MRYQSYSNHFKELFGQRVQKLSIDAGFTCPNRDGSLSYGGCTFCNNDAFNPSYCRVSDTAADLSQPLFRNLTKSIREQIDEGISFHEKRYRKASLYLAYFQAYSNTYGDLDSIRQRYEEALAHEKVIGLIVGTRPDCIDEQKLDYFASLAQHHYVAIEYGIESCYDKTLARVHRGHDFACTQQAIRATAQHGLPCGGHLILGLPGESRDEILDEARIISQLPLSTLKLHQLQILNGSLMALEREQGLMTAENGWAPPFQLEEYITLVCDFLERLRPDIVVERFAGEVPPRYQAAPERSWHRPDGRLIRNEEIPVLVEQELEQRGTQQGSAYTPVKFSTSEEL